MSERIEDVNNDSYRVKNGLSPKRGPAKKLLDDKGNTIWHYWACSKNPDLSYARWKNKLIKDHQNTLNYNGEHALHKICLLGNEKIFDFYINTFSIPENINEKQSLLNYATWSGNIDLVKKIYSLYPENIDKQDEDGLTCLMIAINREKKEIVELLLLSGANPNIIDNKGKNALFYAAEKGDVEIKEMLEEDGADIHLVDKNIDEILEKYLQKTPEEIKRCSNYWVNKYLSKINI